MLKILLISIAVLCIGFIAIFNMAKSLRRPHRKAQFESHWDELNNSNDCEDARELYEDGMHVHRKYGVQFDEIGCREGEALFRQAAIHALQRAFATLYETGDESSPLFNDRALKIRADIAHLKTIGLDDEQKKALANRFVTT